MRTKMGKFGHQKWNRSWRVEELNLLNGATWLANIPPLFFRLSGNNFTIKPFLIRIWLRCPKLALPPFLMLWRTTQHCWNVIVKTDLSDDRSCGLITRYEQGFLILSGCISFRGQMNTPKWMKMLCGWTWRY